MSEVPLQPGETIIWHRGQGTFHRGHDDAFAISDRNAWLFLRRFSVRGRWIRIPLADIESASVLPAPAWRGLAGQLLFPLVVVIVTAQVSDLLAGHLWIALSALALLFAFAGWMLANFVRSLRGRTRLVLVHRGGRIDWVSYPDTHADEKRFDQRLLVEFATRLGEGGVPVRIADGLEGSGGGPYP